MEDKLLNIRNSMMKTVYKDLNFPKEQQQQIISNIKKENSKKLINIFTIKKAIPIFCGIISLFILIILSNSVIRESNGIHPFANGKLIDDSHLIQDLKIENSKIIYKPVTYKTAKKVVAFPFGIPLKLPFESKDPSVVITKWNTINHISLDLTFTPLKPNKSNAEYITLNVSNFPNIVSSIEKQKKYQEKVKLNNDSVAIIQLNPNVSMISWKVGDLEYDLNYFSFNKEISKQDKILELIKMANSVN